jgi:hypothetical protein
VGTSSLRGVILAAAVLIGILGIAKAFPNDATRAIAPPGGGKGTTASPTTSPSTPPKTLPPTTPSTSKPRTKGVTVQILNGSGKLGIAASTTETLKSKHLGFDVQAAGNYPGAHLPVTTIFYKQGFKDSATYLAQKMFSSATLKQSTNAGFTADLTVVLGLDFAGTTG